MKTKQVWSTEIIFHHGNDYLKAVEQAIANATQRIDIETYIFDNDDIGQRIVHALIQAKQRGVLVRVLVDGIGSRHFENDLQPQLEKFGILTRIYHHASFKWLISQLWKSPKQIKNIISTLNKRNHKKVILIDDHTAFIGSINITKSHFKTHTHLLPWRDTSVMVQGSEVRFLHLAFLHTWSRSYASPHTQRRDPICRKINSTIQPRTELVKLNHTRTLRHHKNKEFIQHIKQAQTRIWLTTPYLVPHILLLNALVHAAQRGVDVRILVPDHSDLYWIKHLSMTYYRPLIDAHIQVFEYLPSVLHAKVSIIDDHYLIGSTNMNHRSFIHDLEVDVAITQPSTQQLLVSQYQEDENVSRRLNKNDLLHQKYYARAIGQLLCYLKYFS